MRCDHIGWITTDPVKFEAFWCDIMGFVKTYESRIPIEQAVILFQIHTTALIRRYSKPGFGPEIEIHCLENMEPYPASPSFGRMGINHISIHTGGPGSREEFLQTLPVTIRKSVFKNPGGWLNIFIQDFEGNWIELKETF